MEKLVQRTGDHQNRRFAPSSHAQCRGVLRRRGGGSGVLERQERRHRQVRGLAEGGFEAGVDDDDADDAARADDARVHRETHHANREKCPNRHQPNSRPVRGCRH